jgi:hypothetical protein
MELAWTIIGSVVGAAGLMLAAWALGWDRARGRRRCPKCWYDMAGVAGLQCPECGRTASNESRLLRTRRRPAWFILGALALVGAYCLANIPRILKAGYVGAIPTTGLIWWVARYEPPEKYNSATSTMSKPTKAAAELARRATGNELWGWQWRYMLNGLGVIHSRDRWPRGVPFEISTGVPQWLLSPTMRLHVTSNVSGEANRYQDHILPWVVRTLGNNEDQVGLTIQLGKWSGGWQLHVTQVDSPEQAIDPVRSTETDAAVRRALRAALRSDPNPPTQTKYMLGAQLYRDKGPLPEDLAVGATVQFKRDGQVAAEWPLLMKDSPYGEPVDWSRINAPEPGWNEDDDADMARWTVTVRGNAAVAMRDLTRNKYWDGEWTVPLTEFMGKPAKPPP